MALEGHSARELPAGEIDALVHRVVGRVLAERGNARLPAHRAGVHVTVQGSPATARPASAADPVPARSGADLVSAASLAETPDGAVLAVARGAIVTDLAREEALRRGIRIVETSLSASIGARVPRRVALGADHGGFRMKTAVGEWLRELGIAVLDLGTYDENAVDYPDVARAVAEAVVHGRADLGICVDGAGIGSAIAANKVPGVRAATCWDAQSAHNAREHNHANVLAFGGKLPASTAHALVHAFLATPVGGDRHARRVAKIAAIEQAYGPRTEPSPDPSPGTRRR